MAIDKTNTPPLVASDYAHDGKFHLLLAASGSVATIKIPNIIQAFSDLANLSIRLILTHSSSEFLQGQTHEQPDLTSLAAFPNVDGIYLDNDEWKIPWSRGAPILHIELRRWADLMVVAPLSANTLAKLGNGLSDNLLTSVVRAWEVQGRTPLAGIPNGNSPASLPVQKRIVVCPAMNTAMWRHPLTSHHLRQIEEFYHWMDVMPPIQKTLACGDTGDGAMCDWKEIVAAVKKHIASKDEEGKGSVLSGEAAVGDA